MVVEASEPIHACGLAGICGGSLVDSRGSVGDLLRAVIVPAMHAAAPILFVATGLSPKIFAPLDLTHLPFHDAYCKGRLMAFRKGREMALLQGGLKDHPTVRPHNLVWPRGSEPTPRPHPSGT